MSYDKDHELDHDYAGEAAFERWEREQELTRALGGDTDDPDDYQESHDDDGDGPDDRQCECCGQYSNTVIDVNVPSVGDTAACEKCRNRAISEAKSFDSYERHLKQVADVVDDILGGGRR